MHFYKLDDSYSKANIDDTQCQKTMNESKNKTKKKQKKTKFFRCILIMLSSRREIRSGASRMQIYLRLGLRNRHRIDRLVSWAVHFWGFCCCPCFISWSFCFCCFFLCKLLIYLFFVLFLIELGFIGVFIFNSFIIIRHAFKLKKKLWKN